MKRKKVSPDAGFFLSALCGAAILLSFCLPLSALPKVSLCWFYNLTHVPCPGCGLTRSFICISHGDWKQASQFNPFGFVWYFLAAYGFLRPFLIKYFINFSRPIEGLLKADFFFPSLLILMFLVWGWRICS